MDVLIIGGNKFVGKRLAEKLVNNKHNVTLLNRGNVDDGLGSNVERIRCDRNQGTQLVSLIQGRSWDIIVDQVCFNAIQALMACKVFEGKVSHYIFTSSDGVYPHKSCLREEDFDPTTYSFDTQYPSTDYHEGKRQAESVFQTQASFPVISIRFPLILDIADPTKRLHFHVERIMKQKEIYFPNLNAETSMVDADSASQVLYFLTTVDFKGPINAAAPQAITFKNFVEMIGKTLDITPRFATKADKENQSPYGLEKDLATDVSRLKSLGFICDPISRWLPKMVLELSTSIA